MNNSGQVAFAQFNGPNGITQEVVLADPNGTITTLASTADGFIDVPFVSTPRINDAGDLAYRATTSGGGIGVWVRYHDNGPSRLASKGEPAPGVNGLTFDLVGAPLINSAGSVAFAAYLEGSSVSSPTGLFSIWSNSGGHLAPVVLLGDDAPGLSGAVFKWISEPFSFNKIGQVVIQGAAGLASNTDFVSGIWATDRFGDLQLIAAGGNQLDVDNGPGLDLRTISSVYTLAADGGGTGNENGMASAFNERARWRSWPPSPMAPKASSSPTRSPFPNHRRL